MERVEVLLAAVTPGILVLAYGVTKTRGSWSSEALWTAFLLGGLGVIVAIPIELLIRWLIGLAALVLCWVPVPSRSSWRQSLKRRRNS